MNRLFSAALALAILPTAALARQEALDVAPLPVTPAPAVEGLRRDLTRIIEAPDWSQEGYGVLVVSLDRGDTLFALNPDRALAPASNTKLFSTAAALYYLGPDFRYSTLLLADGPILGGVLEGDLILYGTGDPSISGRMLEGPTAVTRRLVDMLAAAGVTEVRGDVVGDGSYFDDDWTGPGWQENDLDAWYGAPVGALSLAENVVTIRFTPTARGAPAAIRTTPATRELALENRVVTVTNGANRVSFERREDRLIAIGQVRVATGGIARTVPVVDPANFAAAALRATLEERGIAVTGRVRTTRSAEQSRVDLAAAPAAAASGPTVIAEHRSPPLSDIVTVTNHVSHNLFAEALLKTVGRVAIGEGSFRAGARAVLTFLENEVGSEVTSIAQVDGSGLSRNNLLTARATIHLLDFMPRSGVWESYLASLPQAAVPTGLERRMQGTAAAGNLRAKTGTIRRVSALSGYVTTVDGERLAFSILANDVPSTARAKRSEDAIGARLAAFSRIRSAGAYPATAAAMDRAGVSAVAAPDATARRVHRVSAGETLEGIAKRYGLSVTTLLRANPGIEPRRLQIGQPVRIPSG